MHYTEYLKRAFSVNDVFLLWEVLFYLENFFPLLPFL